jgi:hypothetical protein
MVIRVEVPSFSAASASLSPRAESSSAQGDGQLSAMARLGASVSTPPRAEREDEGRGHVSSVMPTATKAAAGASVLPEVTATDPIKTPVSILPSSETPEISVGVLSMPHLRAEPVVAVSATVPLATAAPVLIPLNPAPVLSDAPGPQRVLTLTPGTDAPKPMSAASDFAHPDEGSGVRHVLLRNEPGVLREVCSPVLLNRCS